MNLKKTSFVCLCLIMLLAAFASAQPIVPKGGLMTVDGAQYDSALNQAGSGWSWDAQSKKLTLSGYDGGAIYGGSSPFNVEIAAVSSNKITASGGQRALVGGTLNLTGTGTLTIGVPDDTAKADFGVYGDYYLNINGPTLNISNCTVGLYGYYSFNLTGAAITCSNVTKAIQCSDKVIFNGGSITVDGAVDAIYARKGFDITGTTFNIKNVTTAFSSVHSSSDMVSTFMALKNSIVMIENCTRGFYIVSGYGYTNIFTATGSDITIRNASFSGISSNSANFSGVKLRVTGSGAGVSVSWNLAISGGCDFYVRSTNPALNAGTITITKSDKLDLASGKAPLNAYVELNGNTITCEGNRILIESGAVVQQGDKLVILRVGNDLLEDDALDSDASGAGWAWSASDQKLTLNGYNGGSISGAGGAFDLAVSGDNTITGTLRLPKTTIKGSGSLTVTDAFTPDAGITIEDIAIKCKYVTSSADLTLKDCSFESENSVSVAALAIDGGSIKVEYGIHASSMIGKNAAITINRFYNGFEVTDSVSLTGCTYNATYMIKAGKDVTLKNVVFSDLDEGASRNIISTDGSVSIDGGTGKFRNSEYAISAPNGSITITGKANLTAESPMGAFNARKVTLNGTVLTLKGASCEIVNGVLQRTYSNKTAIYVDGTVIYTDQVDQDFSGAHWSWSGKNKTLTLTNYDDTSGYIGIGWKDAKVALAPGSWNRADTIGGSSPFTITGSGTFWGNIDAGSKLTISGGARIVTDSLSSDKPVDINGARVMVDKDIMLWAPISITNGYVEAESISGSNITITGSTVITHYGGDDRGDLYTDNRLSIKSSAVLFSQIECDSFSSNDSMLFGYYSDDDLDCYVLLKSCSVGKSFVLPPNAYYIPKGIKLSVTGGARVLFQGALIVDGKTSGNIICPSTVETLTLSGPDTVTAGRSVTLTPAITPSGAKQANLEWDSSDTSIATVNSKGVMTGMNVDVPTEVMITVAATDGSGVSAEHKITVMPVPYRVTLMQGETELGSALTVDLEKTGSLTLSAKVLPALVSQTVTWSSSAKKVAAVDATGNVTLFKTGSATITATTADGSGIKGLVKLNITRLVDSISITGPSGLIPGASGKLSASVIPVTRRQQGRRLVQLQRPGPQGGQERCGHGFEDRRNRRYRHHHRHRRRRQRNNGHARRCGDAAGHPSDADIRGSGAGRLADRRL